MYYLCDKLQLVISFVVTKQLICAFIFAVARNRISHESHHLIEERLFFLLDTRSYF